MHYNSFYSVFVFESLTHPVVWHFRGSENPYGEMGAARISSYHYGAEKIF